MEVVLLIEFEATAPGRAALLERVGALALSGRGRLSFLGTAPGEASGPDREVLAVGLARAAEATALVARWHEEGALPAGACVRHLAVQPLWSMEPLALMFP
jgi:hypothetical protein